MINEEIRVLDHGFVKLKQQMGDDLAVANAARVSFELEKEFLDLSDEGLIRFLMRERHGTPFEHNAFTFHVKAPIFVAREWFRHRIGSFNEVSGRYKEFTNPDFYLPDEYRTQTGKPGAYTFEKWNQSPGKDRIDALVRNHYQDCYDLYRYQVENGIAKEMARNVLPFAMYTQFWWTLNARSIMNFISLRNEETALWEIQQYAKIVEEILDEYLPVTVDAFIKNDRRAP